MPRKHSHYFKPVPAGVTHIDVYRLLEMFGVTDQALGHAIKKLLVAGGRGAKDKAKDVQEAIDTLQRRMEMWNEDSTCGEPRHMDEGWVSWDGVGVPDLPVFRHVDVKTRDGMRVHSIANSCVRWQHTESMPLADVVAYRMTPHGE